MATHYASSLATGSGTGTLASPWTLAQMMSGYAAGDQNLLLADGIYSISAGLTMSLAGSAAAPTRWSGANATSGVIDGSRAHIQVSSGTFTMVSQSGNYHDFDYLELDANGTASAIFTDNAGWSRFSRSLLHGSTASVPVNHGPSSTVSNNEYYSCTGSQIKFAGHASGIYVHDCSGTIGVFITGSAAELIDSLIESVTPGAAGVSAVYINGTGNTLIRNVTIDGSNYHAVYVAAGWATLENVLATNSTQTAFDAAASSGMTVMRNCAGYGNSAGDVGTNISRNENFASVSADPYVARASKNFALNPSSAAYASLKAKSLPSGYGATTANSRDIGAPQHQDSGGGGSSGGLLLPIGFDGGVG